MLVVRKSTHTVWQLGALTSVMRSTRVFKKREIVSVPHLISFPPAGGAQLNYLNCRTINSPPPTPVFDLSSPFPLFHSRCLCICPCCLCQLHSWITSTFDVIHELRALSALRCLRCLGYAQYACTCTCSYTIAQITPHALTHTRMHVRTYIHEHKHIHVHIHIDVHVHIHMHIHTHILASTSTYTYTHNTHTRICTQTQVHAYTPFMPAFTPPFRV